MVRAGDAGNHVDDSSSARAPYRPCNRADAERLLDSGLADPASIKSEIRTATTENPFSGSLLAAAPQLLLQLIGSADDRAPMWSNAPRSVGAMGAANRSVVPITVMMVAVTVMVRLCLVDSHSPIGADASGSTHAIDTGGCVARLSWRAISGDAQHSVFHLRYLLLTEVRMISSLLYNENPGHDDRGSCPYSISRCREMHHLRG